ncbi:Beta-fimbriae probable major subunit [Pseudomonas sp. R3-18-08]|nr:Beta-fimbriae probable major subunit [Pseudomonas sp. R3-18-08]
MKKIVGLTLGLVCLAANIGAHAATSAELIVRGVIKPAACNLSMSGGGIINYGDIPSGQLSQTAFNALTEKTTPITVSCGNTPAKFGLKFVDLQAGSKVTGILTALGVVTPRRTTLGWGLWPAGERVALPLPSGTCARRPQHCFRSCESAPAPGRTVMAKSHKRLANIPGAAARPPHLPLSTS